MKRKRKQKPKKPRVKQKLEAIIAKLTANSSVKDIQDLLLNIGLAYAGYEALRDWKGALVGPISLKLATSGNIVSGTTGVAGLTLIGLALLGQGAQHWATIPGTDIKLPQSIPDPRKYVPEQIAKQRAGEQANGFAVRV